MQKKKSNVPVFLIYAGVIHALGLALLLPMLITLPRPASSVAPQPAAIDVEIVPAASLPAKIESDSEQTAALPSAEPQPEGEAVANVSPDAQAAAEEEPAEAEPAAADKAAPKAAAAKAAPRAAKKPVVHRSRPKPAVKRAAKANTKIFNGALSGLFSPGAPAKRR